MKDKFALERTLLAEERTLYSKERTIMTAIGVFLAMVGLGFGILRFFPSLGVLGSAVIVVGLLGVVHSGFRLLRLDRFVRRVEDSNRPFFKQLKKRIK